MKLIKGSGGRLAAALLAVIIATTGVTTTPIGGDGEAEELIAIADEGSANAENYVGVQLKPNLHKRSAYRVLESAGLHSHFRSAGAAASAASSEFGGGLNDVDDFKIFNSFARAKREISEKVETEAKDAEKENVERLPTPEAQIMDAEYYRKSRSRLSDDSVAQATGDSGLRRVPRVNFVTQPRSLDDLPEHRDLKASNANIDPMYRRPAYDSYMPNPRPSSAYPPQSYYNRAMMDRGRFFDAFPSRTAYDRYDPMMMGRDPMARDYMSHRYDPYNYYQSRQMHSGYYPDRRYDYPDMQSAYPVNSGYANNYLDNMGYPMNPNRRMIYYANLPEVVRGGNPGESRSGYYYNNRGGMGGGGAYPDDRYDEDRYYNNRIPGSYMDDYNYRYYRDMNQFGLPPPPQPPPSVIYSSSGSNGNRLPDRDRDSNKDDHRTKNQDSDSKTQTVSSNIRIQDSSTNGNNKGYRNYDSGSGSNNNQAPSSDFTQPHYRME